MIPPIVVKIMAFDTLAKTLGKSQSRINKFGKTAKSVGRTMTMGLTLPMAAFGYNTLKTAGDFEYTMNRVKVLTGATGKEFEKLEKEALRLGRTTQFTASQVGEGMQFLAQSGRDADQIFAEVVTTVNAAAANLVDMGTAAKMSAIVMSTFEREGLKLQDVTDIMTRAGAKSLVTFEDMFESFRYGGQMADKLGMDLETTATAFALLSKGGLIGSIGGTAFMNAMVQLVDLTPKGISAMKHLGISFTDVYTAIGKPRPLQDLIKVFEKKKHIEGFDKALMQIFARRGGRAMMAWLKAGSKGWDEMSMKMKDWSGFTQKVATVQMSGFKGQMLALISAFEGLQHAIAKSGILKSATKLAEKFTEFFRKAAIANPELLKLGFIIGTVAAVIGPLLVGMGLFAGSLAFLITPIGLVILKIGAVIAIGVAFVVLLKKFPIVMGIVGIALGAMLGPIWLVLTAVGLLITHWDELTETFKIVWEWIKKVGTALAEFDLGTLGKLFGLVGSEADQRIAERANKNTMSNLYTMGNQNIMGNINVNVKAPPGTEVTAQSNEVDMDVTKQGPAFSYK